MYDCDVLEGLKAELDKLCESDPIDLRDSETIVELHRCLARLEAVTTTATAAFDAAGEWDADGARSAAAWLRARCHLPPTSAHRRVRLGRELRHLPATEDAWLAGDIHDSHVSSLVGVRKPATEEALERDEEMLVGEAKKLHFSTFSRVLAYWAQHADPDGTENEAKDNRDKRKMHLSQSFGGMWFGDLVLDPISGAVVDNELRRIERELFEVDWAEARERLGDRAGVGDLARTPAQRRADAVVEMARRSGTAPADGRRPEPLFSVFVGFETLAGRICELANGTVVNPGSLVDWLDEAWIERIVFDGPSRVIDVGVARRIFAGATRRAVQVRDRECFHEYCDVPVEQCQIDHKEPWSAGGPTTTKNGRLACGFHNRRRNRGP
ncbi:MAG: hypothetical protein CYG61_07225 [Actinobacteria bacterium]|nr:MAG: hypothetical protein CYG61_07225 [Actinomycetota bacterium]